MLTVSALYRFPLKSVRGQSLKAMELDAKGVTMDRRWMVVGSDGGFITQRKQPRMCLVQADYDNETLTLSVECAGDLPVTVAESLQGKPFIAEVWGDKVSAFDCGDRAAQWWSDYLEQDCRMVFMAEECYRPVFPDRKQSPAVSFADRFPLLLISEASLAFINQHLDKTVEMLRFRPNLVVSGCEAFAEDQWQRIRIGEIEFDVAEACARCGIPAINPDTARPEKAVLKVLNEYRGRDQQVFFGQNIIHQHQGMVHLGQTVEILA